MDQVRGGKSCVTTRFRGKVNNNLPPKYNVFDMSNESPLIQTRGAKAGRKPAEGKGKGKKRGGGGIALSGRGGENGLDSGDETENEINEIIEEWEDFSEQAKIDAENKEHEQRNLLVVLNTLFNCFPREIVQDIKEVTKDNNSEDHVWIKQIVDNALADDTVKFYRENKPVETVGNPSGRPRREAALTADAPPYTPAPFAATQALTGAPAVNSNADIEERVKKEITVKLDDIYRRKNIIISGMAEGFDDYRIVCDLFRAMGIEYLINQIESAPIRLGPPHNNGKIRAVKVELRNEKTVEQVLNAKYELKWTNNYYLIYINKDLSRTDRDREIQARKGSRRNEFDNAARGAGQRRREEGEEGRSDRAGRGEGGGNERKREVGAAGMVNPNESENGTYALPPPIRGQENQQKNRRPLTPNTLFSSVVAGTAGNTNTTEATGTTANVSTAEATSMAVNKSTTEATGMANVLLSTPARLIQVIASPFTLFRAAINRETDDVGEKSDDREGREIVNVAVTTEETTNSGNEEWGGESTAAY